MCDWMIVEISGYGGGEGRGGLGRRRDGGRRASLSEAAVGRWVGGWMAIDYICVD